MSVATKEKPKAPPVHRIDVESRKRVAEQLPEMIKRDAE